MGSGLELQLSRAVEVREERRIGGTPLTAEIVSDTLVSSPCNGSSMSIIRPSIVVPSRGTSKLCYSVRWNMSEITRNCLIAGRYLQG
jgi:hypothetical protein